VNGNRYNLIWYLACRERRQNKNIYMLFAIDSCNRANPVSPRRLIRSLGRSLKILYLPLEDKSITTVMRDRSSSNKKPNLSSISTPSKARESSSWYLKMCWSASPLLAVRREMGLYSQRRSLRSLLSNSRLLWVTMTLMIPPTRITLNHNCRCTLATK